MSHLDNLYREPIDGLDESIRKKVDVLRAGMGNVEPWEPWGGGSRGGEKQFSHGI